MHYMIHLKILQITQNNYKGFNGLNIATYKINVTTIQQEE